MISTSLRLPRIKLKEQLFLTAIANARDRGSLKQRLSSYDYDAHLRSRWILYDASICRRACNNGYMCGPEREVHSRLRVPRESFYAQGKYRDAPILYYGTRIGTRHSYNKIITVFFLFATCPDISIQLIGDYRSRGLISALEMQSIARSRRFQSFASESAYHCRVESAISRSAPILRSKYRDSEMLTSQI